jgi:diacylglycerol kinase (ATP)
LKKVLIILNPVAGKGKSLMDLPEVQTHLKAIGYLVQVYQTSQNADYTGINNAIEIEVDLHAIVVMGGDGTLNDVINCLPKNNEVPLLVLPCGSGNDFATFWHGSITNKQILEKLVEFKVQKVDCGKCNERLFINGLGIGFDGWVAGKANDGPQYLPASFKYHLAILRGLFTYKSFYTNHGQSLIIAVANGITYGGGFKIAPNANPSDGKLDLWQIKPISVGKRPYFLDLIKKGKHESIPGPYEHSLIEEISIISYKPLPAHLDGEYFESETFKISVISHYITLVK